MPLPPALTPEQRQAALAKAAEARRQRAEVKAKLKAGSISARGAVRPGHSRRRAREAQGRERARVAARVSGRCRRAASCRSSTSARAVACAGSGATNATGCCTTPRSCGAPDLPRPVLLVLAGPSAVGKGTVIRRLLEREPRLWFSVSANTPRPAPRRAGRCRLPLPDPAPSSSNCATPEGSSSGSTSTAISRARPAAPVEEHLAAGDDVLLEIDVQGALEVREQFPEAVLVFLKAAVTARSSAAGSPRGATPIPPTSSGGWRRRRRRRPVPGAFDHVVVNDDVDAAVAEVAGILSSRRAAG